LSLNQTMAALMVVMVMAVLIPALAAAQAELVAALAALIPVLVMAVLIPALAVALVALAVATGMAVMTRHAQVKSVLRTGISPANAPWKPLCRDLPTVFSRPPLSRLPTGSSR